MPPLLAPRTKSSQEKAGRKNKQSENGKTDFVTSQMRHNFAEPIEFFARHTADVSPEIFVGA